MVIMPKAASPPGRTRSRGCAPSSGSGRSFSKKRGLTRKAGPPVHDALVARQFTADRPDRIWLTDGRPRDVEDHRADPAAARAGRGVVSVAGVSPGHRQAG